MDIQLWYSKNMKQWRWTLFDNQLPIHKSGQKYDLREAMIDVATTVETMIENDEYNGQDE